MARAPPVTRSDAAQSRGGALGCWSRARFARMRQRRLTAVRQRSGHRECLQGGWDLVPSSTLTFTFANTQSAELMQLRCNGADVFGTTATVVLL